MGDRNTKQRSPMNSRPNRPLIDIEYFFNTMGLKWRIEVKQRSLMYDRPTRSFLVMENF